MSRALFTTWTAARTAAACGGAVFGSAERRATGITNDSRRLRAGDLFVALAAERDGHAFIDGAREAGAAILLVNESRRPKAHPDEAVVAVQDTFEALRRLGSALWQAHGESQPGRVALAITGSNGKTTTKELAARLLEAAYPGQILRTAGNLNNHIGLPMTLCRLAREHRYTVLEMGASVPGDLAMLVAIAPPQRVAVTSVAAAHLAGLGDEQGVAHEKGQIASGQPAPDLAVIPARWRQGGLLPPSYDGPVRTFGDDPDADVRVVTYEPSNALGAKVQLTLRDLASVPFANSAVTPKAPLRVLDLELGLLGRHNARNLAAAVALTWELLPGDDRAVIVAEVARAARPVAGRLTWQTGRRGVRLLDDSYNANPASLAAALQVLAEQPGHRWLVVGDMLELGDGATAAHVEAGRRAGAAGCDRVWAVGEHAEDVLAGAREAGVSEREAFDTADACAAAAVDALGDDVVVLVKGSRGIGLEAVVNALLGEGD